MLHNFKIDSEHEGPRWMQTKLSMYLFFSWNFKWYLENFHSLLLALQHAIKIGDVADGEAEDLDLRELLVWMQGGQERSQRAEGRQL